MIHTTPEANVLTTLRLVDALASCNGCDFEDALDNPMGLGPTCLAASRPTVQIAIDAADRAVAGDRDATIRAIRTALRARTGKSWSVTGGRGTAWGWIKIHSLPADRVGFGYMSDADRATLARALGLTGVHMQGVSIPAGTDYRLEYIARAEGEEPTVVGTPYWD